MNGILSISVLLLQRRKNVIQSHYTWMAEGFVICNRLRGEFLTIADPYTLEKESGASSRCCWILEFFILPCLLG